MSETEVKKSETNPPSTKTGPTPPPAPSGVSVTGTIPKSNPKSMPAATAKAASKLIFETYLLNCGVSEEMLNQALNSYSLDKAPMHQQVIFYSLIATVVRLHRKVGVGKNTEALSQISDAPAIFAGPNYTALVRAGSILFHFVAAKKITLTEGGALKVCYEKYVAWLKAPSIKDWVKGDTSNLSEKEKKKLEVLAEHQAALSLNYEMPIWCKQAGNILNGLSMPEIIPTEYAPIMKATE